SVESLTRRLKNAGADGDRTASTISNLGVAVYDANGNMRSTGSITDDLIRSLAGMENVSQRNVIASELFGRQWSKVAPILALGADGIEDVRQSANDLGTVLGEDTLNASSRFLAEFGKLGKQFSAIKH